MNPTNQVNERLRAAVNSVQAPAYLDSRIRAQIRAANRKSAWGWLPVPVGALALALAGVGIAYELGHLRLTAASREAYISKISYQVATLMRVGLGDHVHCSVFRKYPKNPPTMEKFVQDLGPQYAGLIPIVRQSVPQEYELVMAHQCTYHKRNFIHLSLKNEANLLSLVVARKREGESFHTEGLLPSLVQSGLPVYQAGVQRFQMASFESRDYLVYFISDLSREKNAEMMVAMAGSVKAYLAKLEG